MGKVIRVQISLLKVDLNRAQRGGKTLRRAGVKAFRDGGPRPASKSRGVLWPVRWYHGGGRPAFLVKVDFTAYVLLLFGRRQISSPTTFSRNVAPGPRPHSNVAPCWGFRTRGKRARTDVPGKSYSRAPFPAKSRLS